MVLVTIGAAPQWSWAWSATIWALAAVAGLVGAWHDTSEQRLERECRDLAWKRQRAQHQAEIAALRDRARVIMRRVSIEPAVLRKLEQMTGCGYEDDGAN
jgi:hypothetical protein